MKVTTRTPLRGKRRSEPDVSHRRSDIFGVLLLALAVVALLSLFLGDTGVIGRALSGFLKLLFGKGAWGMPVVLAGVGVAVIRGRRSIEVTNVTIGLFLMFLALLGTLARPLADSYFDPTVVAEAGGYLGAIVGWAFDGLLGQAKMVGTGALGVVGFILCGTVPLMALIKRLQLPQRDQSRKESRDRLETPRRAVVRVHEPELEAGATEEPKKERRAPLITQVQQPVFDLSSSAPKEGYQLPPMTLLADAIAKPKRTPQEMQANIETLEGTLEEFGIEANVVEVAAGPTVTRYEIQLGPGVRVAKIVSLADNIAMNLAAHQVRVEAPIPGKAAIGVEVPNSHPTPVTLREVCETNEFMDHPSRLYVALGQDVSGQNKYADLTKMPHLLIGGATNSGKSIGLASLIMSLLMRNTPKDVRLVMIDPKRVELTLFDGTPHLMCPVIKDIKEAPGVLRAVWREMDRRYDLFSDAGVRNIDGWNEKATFQERMPYIVVIIDELADLMIAAKAEVETTIVRLAQLARAVGIHIVIATQRPSVDVITGIIKANIPSRIAFSVASQVDARTILDQKGAEDLIGRGDMLFMPIDANKPVRVQGCYVSEKEIAAVCNFWREQEKPAYTLVPLDAPEGSGSSRGSQSGDDDDDPLWAEAIRFVAERGQASTSMLQRRFSIGFQRASRLLDVMEEKNIVGARDGPRPREVLISLGEVDAMFGGGGGYDTGWIEENEEH
jgi:DNA segregation ATPase FtsK/SpoIIIE, S-DNA-T family